MAQAKPSASTPRGTPGPGTHLATGLATRPRQAGHRVLFATMSEWVDRLAIVHHASNLQTELLHNRPLPAAGRCHGEPRPTCRERVRRDNGVINELELIRTLQLPLVAR